MLSCSAFLSITILCFFYNKNMDDIKMFSDIKSNKQRKNLQKIYIESANKDNEEHGLKQNKDVSKVSKLKEIKVNKIVMNSNGETKKIIGLTLNNGTLKVTNQLQRKKRTSFNKIEFCFM